MKKLHFEKIFIKIHSLNWFIRKKKFSSLILTSCGLVRIGINEHVFVYKTKSSSKTKHINVFYCSRFVLVNFCLYRVTNEELE